MKKFTLILISTVICLPIGVSAKIKCKKNNNPISYCDTSAGRLVLKSGEYSKYYCRQTAVMDKQNVHGCCTWQGGVLLVRMGKVVCADGTVSPICSIQEAMKRAHDYQKSDDSVNIGESQFLD